MVIRVKPTPTRFPTNSLYTPMDNTPLYPMSSVCHPWGWLSRLGVDTHIDSGSVWGQLLQLYDLQLVNILQGLTIKRCSSWMCGGIPLAFESSLRLPTAALQFLVLIAWYYDDAGLWSPLWPGRLQWTSRHSNFSTFSNQTGTLGQLVITLTFEATIRVPTAATWRLIA